MTVSRGEYCKKLNNNDFNDLLKRMIQLMDSSGRRRSFWKTIEMARIVCWRKITYIPKINDVYMAFKKLESLGITELVEVESGEKKWKLTKDHKRKQLLLDAIQKKMKKQK